MAFHIHFNKLLPFFSDFDIVLKRFSSASFLFLDLAEKLSTVHVVQCVAFS